MHTTAFAHRPVLLEETLAALALRPDGVYVDATFGRGGHARAVLARLGPRGRLIAIDRDPAAVAAAQALGDPRLLAVHAAMRSLAATLDAAGVQGADGMLFDLGVSSPQLDDPARGFSFRADGPLDMRMDPSYGDSAAQWLATAAEPEIREVIRDYGEERFAKQIAAAIVVARASEPIRTTRQLADLVGSAVRTREPGQDPATRTFQALRIFVNRELEEVSLMLPQAVARLAAGGRLAVISFHSLEDRIVKRFFAGAARPELPADLPIRASEMPAPLLRLVGRAQRPSAAELAENPRARSALLRVAERTAAPFDAAALPRLEAAWRK
ncbi:MAG: ribosomal RNA small subunit methyltransferase H [Betaproteobacteria bacterium SG8_39]|nr:MAG: ribosomal RNA small subunit methyltransferase H [Betaproteobacteria bacterium SG8_39]